MESNLYRQISHFISMIAWRFDADCVIVQNIKSKLCLERLSEKKMRKFMIVSECMFPYCSHLITQTNGFSNFIMSRKKINRHHGSMPDLERAEKISKDGIKTIIIKLPEMDYIITTLAKLVAGIEISNRELSKFVSIPKLSGVH